MPTAYHMVHYRRFSHNHPESPVRKLDGLCRTALGQADSAGNGLWTRARDRVQTIAEGSGGRQLLLNKVADLTDSVFGELCLADSRGLQALLQLTTQTLELSDITTAEVYDLDERTAPSGSQFIRGMAYWLAAGDHLFFVKTSNMSAALLHGYIDWLLRSRTTTLPPTSAVPIQAEFDRSVASDTGDVTRLVVKGNAVSRMVVDTADGEKERSVRTSRTIGDKFVEFAGAIPVVEALLGKAKTDSLLESLGPQEHLAVEAQVKVRGRRTEASKAKLREVANDLADMTDAEVLVEGKDGKVANGDAILRTTMPFDLPQEGSNLLDFNNVADQLLEVYSRFVRDGKIQP